jgi:membrane protein
MLRAFDIPIGWGELFKRTLKEFNADNCLGLGGPALVLSHPRAGAGHRVPGGPDELHARGVDPATASTAAPFLPGDMVGLLEGLLQNVRESQSGGLLTFGFLMAIWSSSAAIVGVIYAMNQVYDIEEGRPWWKVRLTAIGLTIALAIFVLLAFGLVMLGPAIAEWMAEHFGFGPAFEWTWKILQWPLVFALVAFGLALLNYYAPDAEQDWTWITPGAVLATALWLLASLAFRVYITNFADYNETYGSLGGAIILMLWFYISSMAILMGAEMNAEIEHASPHGKDAGEKVPGEKRKLGAAAAREYEARRKNAGNVPRSTLRAPRSRRAPLPRRPSSRIPRPGDSSACRCSSRSGSGGARRRKPPRLDVHPRGVHREGAGAILCPIPVERRPDLPAQEVHPDQVRQGHPEDHQVSEVEDVRGRDDRSQERRHEEERLVVSRSALAKQPHGAALAVIRPGDHRRVREEEDGERQHVREPGDLLAEGSRRQRRPLVGGNQVRVRRVVVRARDVDDQRRHRADHDRVDERLEQGHDAFANGVVGSRRRVRNRRGSGARLVRERRALKPDHQHPDEPAVRRIWRECLRHDRDQRVLAPPRHSRARRRRSP